MWNNDPQIPQAEIPKPDIRGGEATAGADKTSQIVSQALLNVFRRAAELAPSEDEAEATLATC